MHIFIRITAVAAFVFLISACGGDGTDSDATGNIEIKIEFDNLIEDIFINNESDNGTNRGFAYTTSVILDTDNSNDLSAGDIKFSADAEYSQGSNNQIISLSDLTAAIYYFIQVDIENEDGSQTSRANRIATADLIVDTNNNFIIFKTARNQSQLLSTITDNSNLHVSSQYYDINDEVQLDNFPQSGSLPRINYVPYSNTITNFDETGDVGGNYSTPTIVDIKSVTITLTE